jgi:protein-disulfide isomerase
MRTQLLAWAKLGPRSGDAPRRNGLGNRHSRGPTETQPGPRDHGWHKSARASRDVGIRHATTRSYPGWLLLSVLMITFLMNVTNAQGTRRVPPATLQTILAAQLPIPQAGADQWDITLVEYFDYDCPVCRHLEPELRKLLASDPKVRVVHKDWPVFGEASVYAAYCSFAAAREGKYQAAHDALIRSRKDLDSRQDVQTALRTAGFDVRKLDADIQSHAKEYSGVLARNRRETAALGLQGTPGLIVGDQLVLGSIDYPGLERLVAQARTSR